MVQETSWGTRAVGQPCLEDHFEKVTSPSPKHQRCLSLLFTKTNVMPASHSYEVYLVLFFKGLGMENQGGMRGAGPDWGNPRQHPIAFPGQRSFQRG